MEFHFGRLSRNRIFFDVNPEYKSSLRADNEFKKLVMALENEGFESNLNNEKTQMPGDYFLENQLWDFKF